MWEFRGYRTNKMSAVTSSDTATDQTEDKMALQTDKGVSQKLEDVEDRMVTLSEKITLCNMVLDDLKDLSDLLVRKSLQDVTLPQQK